VHSKPNRPTLDTKWGPTFPEQDGNDQILGKIKPQIQRTASNLEDEKYQTITTSSTHPYNQSSPSRTWSDASRGITRETPTSALPNRNPSRSHKGRTPLAISIGKDPAARYRRNEFHGTSDPCEETWEVVASVVGTSGVVLERSETQTNLPPDYVEGCELVGSTGCFRVGRGGCNGCHRSRNWVAKCESEPRKGESCH